MIVQGDCVALMAELAPGSVDAIVTDPPYGLEFMGKEWDRLGDNGRLTHSGPKERDGSTVFGRQRVAYNGSENTKCRRCGKWTYDHEGRKCECPTPDVDRARQSRTMQEWHEAWAREALRILKPGGHLLAFGGSRTYHRLACAIEDAGFEIRDCLAWMYGSGFPKSLDVSKAIDKAAGAEVVTRPRFNTAGDVGEGNARDGYNNFTPHAPATPEAQQWQGWGTALKPAHEPIVLARKPLAGTVAANVLEHGTGALNVDGCRIAGEPWQAHRATGLGSVKFFTEGDTPEIDKEPHANGRWPSNVLLDEEAAGMLDEQSGELSGPGGFNDPNKPRNGHGWQDMPRRSLQQYPGDTGGASRFFYVSKASSAERSAGLDGKVCECTSPQRATYEATEEGGSCSPTSGSGSKPTDPSLTGSRSTTETAISETTPSTTSNSSRPPITSASTPPTTSAITPANGSGAAGSAASGSRPMQSTTTSVEKAGLSTVDADLATLQESSPTSSGAVCASCGEVIEGGRRNVHPLWPTVKPIELMRWLVRLITPPGGVVLDPFTGSGTTGCAATLEGFDFVGFEREAEYVAIAEARIRWWSQHPDGLEIVKSLEAERERQKIRDTGQLGLLS
jgi:DNA modification methylase